MRHIYTKWRPIDFTDYVYICYHSCVSVEKFRLDLSDNLFCVVFDSKFAICSVPYCPRYQRKWPDRKVIKGSNAISITGCGPCLSLWSTVSYTWYLLDDNARLYILNLCYYSYRFKHCNHIILSLFICKSITFFLNYLSNRRKQIYMEFEKKKRF